MFYVKVENGVVVTEPKRVSTAATDSPNADWKPEQMALHGFVVIDIQNEKVVNGQIVKITQQEKDAARIAKENAETLKLNQRRALKQSVATKLKIDPTEIEGLRAIIQDGHLD
jgi:hypothetical protein